MVSGGLDGSLCSRVPGPPGRGWAARAGELGGSESECVEVVGEDRPGGPGARAGLAFQARSVEAVASLEVADAALGAHPELGQTAVGLARVRSVVAADEQPLGLGQMRADRARLEAAVEHASRGRRLRSRRRWPVTGNG